MPRELIFTNGDSAAGLLKHAKLADSVYCWHDILHEGPVPLTDSFAELSRIRGEFISKNYWAGVNTTAMEVFTERDDALIHNSDFDRVSLWFEHDLYDQLQLIQILDWFAHNPRSAGGLHLVQADDYLGQQTPDKIGRFRSIEKPVTVSQLNLAQKAWSAFRQPTPKAWAALLKDDLDPLPFLRPAVIRMLQELPAPNTSLSRTEAQIFKCISSGTKTTVDMLKETWAAEEAMFMGDWSVFKIMDRFAESAAPLITKLEGGPFGYGDDFNGVAELGSRRSQYCNSIPMLTELGQHVLDGHENWCDHAKIDRWWGGTHLTNKKLWRWDRQAHVLMAPTGQH